MGNLTLAAQNSIDTGATFYGDQDTGFELTKLQDTNFSKIWRYTPAASVDGSYAKFAFSLSPVARASHVVLCRHNLGQGAQVRTRAGTSRLDVDFTDGSEITSPWITFGGGTNGTRTNEYGVMLTGQTCPRYEHDRRYYDNGFLYSEDLTQPAWLTSRANKYADGQTVAFEAGAIDPTEKVANGTFPTDISGWTISAAAPASGTWDSSGAMALSTGASANDAVGFQLLNNLVAGRRYRLRARFSCKALASGALGYLGRIGTTAGGTDSGQPIVSTFSAVGQSLSWDVEFVAATNSQYLAFYNFTDNVVSTLLVDNVSVTEIGGQLTQVLPSIRADAYEVRAQVRLVSGDPTFALKLSDGGAAAIGATQTATTKWQWFSASLTYPSNLDDSTAYAGILKTGGAGVLQARRLQIRRGASNGKYRKTTSQRRYQRIGVITEAAATNNCIRSDDLANASWVKAASTTVTPNVAVAPDGTTSMARVTMGSGGDWIQSATFAASGTSRRAASIVFRPDASTSTSCILYITWQTGGVAGSVGMTFNPTTAAIISSQVVPAGTATIQAFGIKDLGNGFYRAYIIGTGADPANTLVLTQVTNNVAGSYVALWGGQNEANFVTTYIPTTTAAVTRAVDTAVVEPTTWVPYVFHSTEGTIYHEAWIDEILPSFGGNLSTVGIENGGNGIYSQFYEVAGSGAEHRISTSVYTGTTSAVISPGRATRGAIRYRSSDWADYLDGTQISTNASAAVPSLAASINLMYVPSCTAYLRRVTLWPTGKSNSDLQALTTSGPSAIDYDSGWSDAMQMSLNGDVSSTWGYDYDVIRTFTDRAVEWVRVGIYDPDKTDGVTPIECGRLFMGKLSLQPGINASFGLTDGWDDSATTFVETQNRRKVFNVLPKLREAIFDLPYLTQDEGALLHEMEASTGLSSEVLYLPDPSDLAYCQRYGFVGLMEKLDPLKYPLFNTRGKSYQIRKKR
jgi:hypothetical protein